MPRALTLAEIADFRERIIDAGERMFSERGVREVTMRGLANALNVSAMTAYRYFQDRDALLAAVRARGFDRFSLALETASKSESDPARRSASVGQAYITFAFEHKEAYRLMFDISQDSSRDYPDLTRATDRAAQTMTEHVKSLIDAGLADGNPLALSNVFWGALHGIVALHFAGKLSPALPFSELQSEMFQVLRRGVAPG